jgi:serine/threonine-protein kinase
MNDELRSLLDRELAGFRLTSMLGEGGMAAVFRGENALNPAIVRAMKVVRPELANRTEFAQRFAEEASILERLQHANVVRFYGVRRDQGYLVMELELLEGEALSSRVRGASAPAPLADAVRWLAEASEGVAAAHALGVVHRDLKPDNLFLTAAGPVKVLDFGIARAVDEADRANRMTVAGTAPGSPPYMAPEVVEGAVPAVSADVYALGMSLWELLVGHHPFLPPGRDSKSSTQLMLAHVKDTVPPLRAARPDAPELLEQVVARALEKDPAKRYPSARELADALRAVAQSLPANAGEAKPAAAASQTQFALPQFQEPRTTGSVSVPRGAAEADKPASRLPWIAVGAVVLLGVGGFFAVRSGGGRSVAPEAGAVAVTSAGAHAPSPSARPGATPAAAASSTGAPELNRWVRIAPAPPGERGKPLLLGVASDKTPDAIPGFRPARGVVAPSAGYELQQHEVTWAELGSWLEQKGGTPPPAPAWLPADAAERAHLPATAIPWETALAYCRSLGGSLPTEEEWELAARGPERRPYAWGSQPIDLARTHVYGGAKATVSAVMSADQDQTPGDDAHVLYDMMGNALEWTSDLYREDVPKRDESWVQADGMSFRAVRGLPFAADRPASMPAEGAAYRQSLCATGPCPPRTAQALEHVGFRCARRAHVAPGGP